MQKLKLQEVQEQLQERVTKVHRILSATLLFTCVLATWAKGVCQEPAQGGTSERGISQSQSSESPVVAKVGDRVIRQDDVDKYVGHEIDELTKRLYLLRSQALSGMIDAVVVNKEAEQQHLTVTQLLQKELKTPHPPSTDAIEREWSNNYDSLRPLGEVGGRYQIVLNIENHDRAEELRQYLDSLRTKDHVAILLNPPVTKLQVRPGANYEGNRYGTTELVVFMDYECPFCRQFEPELESELKSDVALSGLKVTIKQFPLSMHKGAFDAAVAAECASEQDRFLPMHRLLIANQDHSADGLAATAKQAGLELSAFQRCVTGESAKAQVLLDMDEARKNGIEGTPSLFLDGQTFELPSSPENLRKQLEASMKSHHDLPSPQPNDSVAFNQTRK